MLTQIKRLGSDTAIYGISTIVGRFLNFLLVPFYTNILPPGEYGIVAYVYAIIAFLNIVYAYGMESAYFKYSSTREIGTARENFSTPFLSLLVSSAVLSSIVVLLSAPIGRALAIPPAYTVIIPCSAGILFLDTIVIIPFAALRMEHRPGLFATLKFLNIVVNVASNLILLLVFHAGVEGIFLSGLIASAFTAATLLPTVRGRFTARFSRALYRALLAFGLPYIPAGLATMVIQVIDRPILRALTDDATVGIYQANYRLGIFMMLVVSMVDYAWRPFFLSHAAEEGARTMFARVLTYFIAITSGIFLVISFFIDDLVRVRIFSRYIIHPDYWGGLSIVPVVLLAYIFLGIYNNLLAGVYIEKKTARLPAITLAGAMANVAANIVLIPLLGMMGAALATLIAYVVMAAVIYADVRQYYPVPYEWGRIVKITVAAAVTYLLSPLVSTPPWSFAWKVGLLFLFSALLYAFRFFVPEEARVLRSMFTRPARAHSESDPPGKPSE